MFNSECWQCVQGGGCLINHLHCLPNNCITESALDSYVSSVTALSRRGVQLSSAKVPNWNFGQSFFFAGTVITTIGWDAASLLNVVRDMFPIWLQVRPADSSLHPGQSVLYVVRLFRDPPHPPPPLRGGGASPGTLHPPPSLSPGQVRSLALFFAHWPASLSLTEPLMEFHTDRLILNNNCPG